MPARVLSLLLAYLLVIQPVLVWGQESANGLSSSQTESGARHFIGQKTAGFQVVYRSDNSGDRELIAVVDAHSNLTAQYNIHHILTHYSKSDDLHAVYLEGASGDLNPDQFKSFEDERIVRATGDLLLKNRFITGAEYFGLIADTAVSFKGAESQEAYEENLQRFIELKSMQEQGRIKELIGIFSNLIRSRETDRFVELDELYAKVLTSGKNLIPFVSGFYDYYCFDIDEISASYPLLGDFVYVIKKSSYVQSLVEKSLIRLAKYLTETGQHEEDLVAVKYLLFYTGEQDYLERSLKLFEKHSKPMIPNMVKEIRKYLDAQKQLNTADSNEIYLELIRAYRSFYCELEDPVLFDARDALFGILKGCNLNLVPEEVGYFKIREFDPCRYLPFLATDTTLSAGELNGWVDELEKINKLSGLIDRFYTAVEHRNESIFSTINEDLPEHKTGILIIGGYHREIFDEFQQHGFGVTVIRPEIDLTGKSEADIDYHDQLYGRLSSIEKMIYYSWSPIVHRLISQSPTGFINRKAATKVFTAEYVSLMAGAAIQVHLNESQGLDKYQTIRHIRETFARFFDSDAHRTLVETYTQLPGSEFTPREAEIVDYQKIAAGKGFVALFKIGHELTAVQWVPAGVNLASDEQAVLESIPGYKPKNRVNLQDQAFDISFVHIPSEKSVLQRLSSFVRGTALATMIVLAVGLASGFLTSTSANDLKGLPPGITLRQGAGEALNEYNDQLQAGLHNEQQRIARLVSADPVVQARLDRMQPLDVTKISADADVIIFSDHHPITQIAGLMRDSLESLKAQGVTQVALELNSDFQPLFDRWSQKDRMITLNALRQGMETKMGIGVAETTVAVIDEAKRLGMRVVAYDVPDRRDYGGTTSLAVEDAWYGTLQRSLDQYGGKMVMLSGEFHMKRARRDANRFFTDGKRTVSVIYFTGGEMETVEYRGYLTDPAIVNTFTALEAGDLRSQVMVPVGEITAEGLSRTNWLVVLPDAAYAPLPNEVVDMQPGIYVDAGAQRQSMKEIMQLKYALINPHIVHLQEMGVIDDDIQTLVGLDDLQLISGQFGVNPMTTVMGNDVHGYILSSYQREITNRMLTHIGQFEVASQFKQAMFEMLMAQGLTLEQVDQRFRDIRSLLANELRIKYDPTLDTYNITNDIDFVIELFDFYFNSRLTGQGREFFSNPLFTVGDASFLEPLIRQALGDRMSDTLLFSSTAEAASDAYRVQQVQFVLSLYQTAVQSGIAPTEMSIFMMQRPDGGEALKMKMMQKTEKVSKSLNFKGMFDTAL